MKSQPEIELLSNLSLDELSTIEKLIKSMKEKKARNFKKSPSIKSYWESYVKYASSTFSSSYVRSINLSFKHFANYFGNKKTLAKLTIKDFEDFKINLMKHAPKAYKIFLRTISAALNVAKDWGYLSDNPLLKIKYPKRQQVKPVFLNRNELNKILEQTPSQTMSDIIQFAFFTGCRLAEILNLTWNDIDMVNKLISIGSETFETKTRMCRTIPMSQRVYEILRDRENLRKETDKVVFCKLDGFKYNRDYVSRRFKKSVRKAKLNEAITFHKLRHSFSSELVSQGVPINVLQALLGHQSLISTQVYVHSNREQLVNAIKRLDAA